MNQEPPGKAVPAKGGTSWRRVRKGVIRAVLAVVFANVVYLGLLVGTRLLPARPFVARIVEAFQAGDLIESDHMPFDSRRGVHQFTEREILHMLVNRTDSVWADAVGPVLEEPGAENAQCAALKRIVTRGPAPDKYGWWCYTRYWHGYMPVSAALLLTADLATVRRVLKIALYGALILRPLAAGFRHRGLSALAWVLAAVGTLFWAVPYFGQTLTHAPGDIALTLGLAALLAFRRRLADPAWLIPFCAAYGALLAFLDFLTGVVPTAGAPLGPAAYLCRVSESKHDASRASAWAHGAAAFTAFALGAAFTVAAKQGIATMLLGPSALRWFREALEVRLAPAEAPDLLAPLRALAGKSYLLTYGSRPGGLLLLTTAVLAWLAAAGPALRRMDRHAVSDVLALAVGPTLVVAWSLMLPNHTYDHAWFMVRVLIVPIALGGAALSWQLLESPTGHRGPLQGGDTPPPPMLAPKA